MIVVNFKMASIIVVILQEKMHTREDIQLISESMPVKVANTNIFLIASLLGQLYAMIYGERNPFNMNVKRKIGKLVAKKGVTEGHLLHNGSLSLKRGIQCPLVLDATCIHGKTS